MLAVLTYWFPTTHKKGVGVCICCSSYFWRLWHRPDSRTSNAEAHADMYISAVTSYYIVVPTKNHHQQMQHGYYISQWAPTVALFLTVTSELPDSQKSITKRKDIRLSYHVGPPTSRLSPQAAQPPANGHRQKDGTKIRKKNETAKYSGRKFQAAGKIGEEHRRPSPNMS